MKHAFCIIAHHEPALFKRLCASIDHQDVDIFVHIDKKSNLDQFQIKLKHSNLYFVNKPYSVTWGGFSQIKTEILLFKYASTKGSYDYFHLLSGVDIILKPINKILSYFEENKGYEFMGMRKADKFHYDRVCYYHFFVNRSMWATRFYKIETKLQRLLGVERIEEAYFGNNWCSITRTFVGVILSKESWIYEHFRFTMCADEIYKQTIFHLWGTEAQLKDKGSIRLIDWDRGQPYTFTIDDLALLKSTDKLFARKFSSEHIEVVDAFAALRDERML